MLYTHRERWCRFLLNDHFILERINPYLNSRRELSEYEFMDLFSGLTKQEQYEVINIMIANDIELVDEKAEESHELNTSGLLEKAAPVIVSDDFHKLMVMTNEELCLMAQSGVKAAESALLEKNRRFVCMIALKIQKQFSRINLSDEDLIQEGNLGLIEAIHRFDTSKNARFITYSWYWIKQKMTRAAIDTGYLIRLPVHIYEKLMRIFTIRKMNPTASYQQIVEIVSSEENITAERAIYLIGLSELYLDTVSLNELIGEDEDSELGDFVQDHDSISVEDIYEQKAFRATMETILTTLTEREATVIRMRFGFDGKIYTLEAIGAFLGVTRERVRQIEAKAIRKLRHPNRIRHIEGYFE